MFTTTASIQPHVVQIVHMEVNLVIVLDCATSSASIAAVDQGSLTVIITTIMLALPAFIESQK